jgi:putative oxidoreductase
MRVFAKALIILARFCLGLIFVVSGVGKIIGFDQTEQFLAHQGVAYSSLLLAIALLVEILGGLALIFGYKVRCAAFILALYLIPVTYVFHSFWLLPAEERQMQMFNFLKNVAIFGGLLYVGASCILKSYCTCCTKACNSYDSSNTPHDKTGNKYL